MRRGFYLEENWYINLQQGLMSTHAVPQLTVPVHKALSSSIQLAVSSSGVVAHIAGQLNYKVHNGGYINSVRSHYSLSASNHSMPFKTLGMSEALPASYPRKLNLVDPPKPKLIAPFIGPTFSRIRGSLFPAPQNLQRD